MIRRFLPALAAVSLLAGPASAAPAAWTVQKPASKVNFTATFTGQAFHGQFARWDAHIAFDPNDLKDSRVDAAIDTGSASTGDQTRDEALPTPDWFGVKAFPRAAFTSHDIVPAGPGRYVARGTLTIRNVTRPVSLPFTLAIDHGVARMAGRLTIDRSAFGVGQGQWKGGDTVGLNVQVDIAVVAKHA